MFDGCDHRTGGFGLEAGQLGGPVDEPRTARPAATVATMRVRSLQRKLRVAGERGIPKPSVDAIVVTEAGVDGDYNRYRTAKLKGDPGHAVLLIPIETLQALAAEGWPVAPGDLGENITTEGIAYDAMEPGTRLEIGDALLEITEPCIPCSSLAALPYVGREKLKTFIKTLRGRRGWYARVLRGGAIMKGARVGFAR